MESCTPTIYIQHTQPLPPTPSFVRLWIPKTRVAQGGRIAALPLAQSADLRFKIQARRLLAGEMSALVHRRNLEPLIGRRIRATVTHAGSARRSSGRVTASQPSRGMIVSLVSHEAELLRSMMLGPAVSLTGPAEQLCPSGFN